MRADRETSMKIYICGTVSMELVDNNWGRIDFYMSPEACSDHAPCTDECGIREAELVLGDYVKPYRVPVTGMPASEFEAQEARELAICDAVREMLAVVPPDVRCRVATRLHGQFQREEAKARRAQRLARVAR